MPDFVAALEWTAKKVLAASDNLAFLVGGLCRTPEPPAAESVWDEDGNRRLGEPCTWPHCEGNEPALNDGWCCHHLLSDEEVAALRPELMRAATKKIPDSAADSPAVVAAPGPEAQESGRPPRDSANPPAPSAGTQLSDEEIANLRELLAAYEELAVQFFGEK